MPDKFANVETPDGRKYLQKDGVVEVPEKDGQQILAAGVPGVRKYRKSWSMGVTILPDGRVVRD